MQDDMQKPAFMGEENKPDQRSCIFKKLQFFLLIFSDENNIAMKLFEQIVSVIVQLNLNECYF